jgi:hypothetical protein
VTDSETLSVGVELAERWPGKYTPEDLAHWIERMRGFSLHAFRQAIITWKNGVKGHMRPSTDEVEQIIREKIEPPAPGVSAYERTQSYRIQQERNAGQVAAERGSIDSAFASLAADTTTDEMAALCQVAAARYAGTEFGRRLLARGPAGSKFLRQLVIEHVNKGKAVHAGQTSP